MLCINVPDVFCYYSCYCIVFSKPYRCTCVLCRHPIRFYSIQHSYIRFSLRTSESLNPSRWPRLVIASKPVWFPVYCFVNMLCLNAIIHIHILLAVPGRMPYTYLGHNGRLSVARECIRRIVHHAAIVIVDAERVRRRGARLFKVVFRAWMTTKYTILSDSDILFRTPAAYPISHSANWSKHIDRVRSDSVRAENRKHASAHAEPYRS